MTLLRALIVDDVEHDAVLVVRELRRGGFDVAFERVDTPEAMATALAEKRWDIVISDHAMPHFSAPLALALLKGRKLDLPFIIVSGTVSEDLAVEALHAGASDFIAKNKLGRLNSAVERELRSVEIRAEQARIGSTLEAIMACAPGFIIVVNEHGRIQFVNRVLPGHDPREVIGSDWLSYMPPAENARMGGRLRRVLETGVSETYETTGLAPDGSQLWFSSQISPMRDGDRIVGAVVAAQEVTELKRTQIEFAAAQRLAALGTLAAGVAHEINTPVQFVSDSVYFLRDAARDVFGLLDKLQAVRRLAADGAPAAELHDAIAIVAEAEDEADLADLQAAVPKAFARCLDGLARVNTIVRSMKEFAHPAQHEMAPIDLNHAIQTTLTIARHEYKFVAELATDLGEVPPVSCHVNEINQVVLNLLVNAAHAIGDVVKGSDQKGLITVGTRQDGEHVLISIRDTGAGIPDAVAHRIFEPFFTTKEIGRGTGQGLALAWAVVVVAHAGTLTFETRVGDGTTFFVRLPIAGKPNHSSVGGGG